MPGSIHKNHFGVGAEGLSPLQAVKPHVSMVRGEERASRLMLWCEQWEEQEHLCFRAEARGVKCFGLP